MQNTAEIKCTYFYYLFYYSSTGGRCGFLQGEGYSHIKVTDVSLQWVSLILNMGPIFWRSQNFGVFAWQKPSENRKMCENAPIF